MHSLRVRSTTQNGHQSAWCKNHDKRRSNVGFALQILQRRLASSPAAIHRSLERRRKRLEERLREEKLMRQTGSAPLHHAPVLPAYDPDDIDEVPGNEAEEAEEQIVDQATAAATLAELEAEIIILRDLEERALRLKLSGQDAKWRELESILDDPIDPLAKLGGGMKMSGLLQKD
jgi:hypothetical protein